MSTPSSKPVQIVQPIISQQPSRQHLGNQFRPLQNVTTSQSTSLITSQTAPIMHQNVNIMNINMPQMTPSKSGESLSNPHQFPQQINIMPGTVLQLPDGRLVMPQQSNQTIFLQLPPNSSSSPYQSSTGQQPIIQYQSLAQNNSKNNNTQVPSSLFSVMKQNNDQTVTTSSPIAYPKLAPASSLPNSSVSSSDSFPPTPMSTMTPPNIVGNSPEDILSKLDSEISNLESLPNKSDYHYNHYNHLKEIRVQVEALIRSKSNSLPIIANNSSPSSTALQLKPISSVTQSPTYQSRSPSNCAQIRPNFAPLRPRVDSRPKNTDATTDKKAEPTLLPLNEERKRDAVRILSQLNLIPCQPIVNTSAVLVEFRLHSKRFLLKMSRQQKVNLESILVKSPPQKQFDILQIVQQEQNLIYGSSEPATNATLNTSDSQIANTLRKPINESVPTSVAPNNPLNHIPSNHASPVHKLAPLQKPLVGDADMSRPSSVYIRPPLSNSPARMIHPVGSVKSSPAHINPRIIKASVQSSSSLSSSTEQQRSGVSGGPPVNLKVTHLKRMLHADQQLALHPNTRVPFRNESNALLRLLCFHVFQDNNNRSNDLSVLKADRIIKNAETAILQKKDLIVNSAKSLLMKIGLQGDSPLDSYSSDKILLDLDCDLLEEEKSILSARRIKEEEAAMVDLNDSIIDISEFPQECDLLDDKLSIPIAECATVLDESLETNAMQDDQSSLISDSIKTEDTGSIAIKDESYLFESTEEADGCPHKKRRLLVDNGDELSTRSYYTENHHFNDNSPPSSNHIAASSQNYFDDIMESIAQEDVKHSEDPDVDAAIRSILF